jgi:hypothetical protein
MKFLFHKKNWLAGAGVAVVLSLAACKKTSDFLVIEDPLGIGSDIWEQPNAVQYLLNDTYQFIMPTFPYQVFTDAAGNANYTLFWASDENYWSGNETMGKKLFNLSGTLLPDEVMYAAVRSTSSRIGDNRYLDVAKCNIAIANLPGSKTITDASKKLMLGQFYALRGMVYMGLTKVYGGMPLVLEPQNPDNLKLEGRQKARVMFRQIVKDYDSAIANLQGVKWTNDADRGKIGHAAVAALKAKALLWWASPLFNPTNHPTYDPKRWDTAFMAAETAYNVAIAAGYKLMPDYSRIFQVEGGSNSEAILVRSYSAVALKRFHDVEYQSRPASEGGAPLDFYNPTQQMLEAYGMKDGVPFAQKTTSTFTYNDTIFWQNRDPRFEATLAYNGSTWPLSAKTTRKQWTYANARVAGNNESTKPFYVKRFTSPTLAAANIRNANDIGGSGVDWIEIRLAEVMLDYAEAANEANRIDIAKDMVKQIRKRAGIQPGAQDYGLALAFNKDDMRELIMNERMVELAFEGKRNDDLRRTRRMHKLQGSIAQMAQMQFNTSPAGLRDSLEKRLGPNTLGLDTSLLRRDTMNVNNTNSIKYYFKYPYTYSPVANNGTFAMPEYYYFFPLSSLFLNSSPLLDQTIGWEGGTFDPL